MRSDKRNPTTPLPTSTPPTPPVPGATNNVPQPSTTSDNKLNLKQLTRPQKPLPNRSAHQSETTDIQQAPVRSPIRCHFDAALATVMSPSVVAGLGSTIVTLFKAPFSSFVLFSVVCLTARNTYLRVIRESEESTGKGDNTHEAPSRIGLKGFLQEVATSSGLFSTVQGITYLATGLSFFGRDLYLSSTFIIFSFGSLAIARACNLEDRPPKREPLLLEQGLREIGANLPERLKSVLLNPGVFFPIGNLMLIFRDTPFSIFDAPVQMAIFCAGIAVSGAGLVRGLAPLITDRLNLNSGFASTASGIGDILMGATSFSANLNETGLATVLWGISNVLAGLKVSIGKVPESAPNHKQRQEEGEN